MSTIPTNYAYPFGAPDAHRIGHTRPPGHGHTPPVTGPGRFAQVRFGSIAQAGEGGLVAHLGLGTDVAGTIRVSAGGQVSFAEQVLPLPSGTPQQLSGADRASLAASLQQYVDSAGGQADPLWSRLLADLK